VLAVIIWLFLKFVAVTGDLPMCVVSALAISMSMLVLPMQVWLAARHWTELKVGALALAVALYVTSHEAAAVAARLHGGFKFADYARFRAELNEAMTAAGARAGDPGYCPSPFGTYLSPEFRHVYGGERTSPACGRRHSTSLWTEARRLENLVARVSEENRVPQSGWIVTGRRLFGLRITCAS
jgi:hypothetical protein